MVLRPSGVRAVLTIGAVTLLLTSCSSTSALPVPGAPGSPASAAALGSDSATPAPHASDASDASDASAAGGPSGSPNAGRTITTDTMVRVVNLYTPTGTHAGAPVDVWTGYAGSAGAKLVTVPYGQASDYFAVQVPDPVGDLTKTPGMPYTLGFYSAGGTTEADQLITQGEEAFPGQKLTMLIAPTDPNQQGASLQVFADDLGSMAATSGFKTLSIPTPPAGSGVLMLNALALRHLGADPANADSLTASTADGKCVPYLDTDTGKVHPLDSDTMEFFGGTSSLPYVVPPKTPIRVTVDADGATIAAACAGPSIAGPVDPRLAAGGRAYGFLYGSSMRAAKLLVVPFGR